VSIDNFVRLHGRKRLHTTLSEKKSHGVGTSKHAWSGLYMAHRCLRCFAVQKLPFEASLERPHAAIGGAHSTQLSQSVSMARTFIASTQLSSVSIARTFIASTWNSRSCASPKVKVTLRRDLPERAKQDLGV